MPPDRSRHPDRAGALDVELRPVHQQHHRVSDGVFVDRDDLVDPPLDERPRQFAGVLDGDPVGERDHRSIGRQPTGVRCADRSLDADHPHVGPQRLDRDRCAADQSAASERDDDGREIVDVLDQFQPERALSGHDGGIVERSAERHPGRVCTFLGCGYRLGEGGAVFDDGGAERPARVDLGDRGADRNEDLARHTEVLRGERECLGVVAGAAGGDASRRGGTQRCNLVGGTTDLERSGALQVLGFEHDVAADVGRQRERADHRRVLDDLGDDAASSADVVEADVVVHGRTVLRTRRRSVAIDDR